MRIPKYVGRKYRSVTKLHCYRCGIHIGSPGNCAPCSVYLKTWRDTNRDKLNASERARRVRNNEKNKKFPNEKTIQRESTRSAALRVKLAKAIAWAAQKDEWARLRMESGLARTRVVARQRSEAIERAQRKALGKAAKERTDEAARASKAKAKADAILVREQRSDVLAAKRAEVRAAIDTRKLERRELAVKHAAERNRIKRAKRRARERSAPGRLSRGISTRLMAQQRSCCVYCRADISDSYDLDHIVPLAAGGANEDANVQLLCKDCNNRKGALMPEVFAQRIGRPC